MCLSIKSVLGAVLLSKAGTTRKCRTEWELVRRGGRQKGKIETFFMTDVEEQWGPEKRKRGILTKETSGQENQRRLGRTGRKMGGDKTNENSKEGLMREKGFSC